jgi:hypothetical protein
MKDEVPHITTVLIPAIGGITIMSSDINNIL